MRVCVIPARGGSKRIPRKNIKLFHGVPIIQRTISRLLSLKAFDEIVVSTDDMEIKSLAEQAGAVVPGLRPTNLSSDRAATWPVVSHTIKTLESSGSNVEQVCCVYPTAVLLPLNYIRNAFDLLHTVQDCDFVFSACEYDHPIQRSFTLDEGGIVQKNNLGNMLSRTQDSITHYHDAGQFYLGSKKSWLNCESLWEARSIAVTLPRHTIQDIDDLDDWRIAEHLFLINNG